MATNEQRILRYLSKAAALPLSMALPEPKAAEITRDVRGVLTLLHRALASEWLAYYQYWLGAQVARGADRAAIAAELEAHAGEELAHAGLLSDRIVELGDVPRLAPGEWNAASPCKFDAPSDRRALKIVEQNLAAERCAIDFYRQVLDATRESDEVTYDIVLKIIQDEQQHETDLRKFVEDARIGG